MAYKVPIGTISKNTLKSQDIIEKIIRFVDTNVPDKALDKDFKQDIQETKELLKTGFGHKPVCPRCKSNAELHKMDWGLFLLL